MCVFKMYLLDAVVMKASNIPDQNDPLHHNEGVKDSITIKVQSADRQQVYKICIVS